MSEQLQRASRHYLRFDKWDLWAESVPDGEYGYIPGDGVAEEVIDGQVNTFQPAEILAVME